MPPLARAFCHPLEPFPCPVSAFDLVVSSIEVKGNTYRLTLDFYSWPENDKVIKMEKTRESK
jgi:hypothetical protein